MIPKECKRLAEVDFPIAVVSKHSAREKSIRYGHPSTLHLWWARRPLAACRAILLGLLLPDPADPQCPEKFKTEARKLLSPLPVALEPDDDGLRRSLLKFIGDFSDWDLSNNSLYVETARALIKAAHGDEVPLVVDPFAGGGSIPLEALRLGCDAFASDLNPVACLILKVMLEDIPRWGREKVKVKRQNGEEIEAEGLAETLRTVGKEVKDKAEKELAEFYPKDPDRATPIAYLWTRTVRCESPNCGAEIPLVRSFWLSKRSGHMRALRFHFKHTAGKRPNVEFEIFAPKSAEEVSSGTVRGSKATCPCCNTVLSPDRVRAQLRHQRGGADIIFDERGNRLGGARLLVVINHKANGCGRSYRLPNDMDLKAVWKSKKAIEEIKFSVEYNSISRLPTEMLARRNTLGLRVLNYGVQNWGDLFTSRQKISLLILSELFKGLDDSSDRRKSLKELLALCVSRTADYCSANCSLHIGRDVVRNTWARNALPVVWDFYESIPTGDSSGCFSGTVDWVAKAVERFSYALANTGQVQLADAGNSPLPDESANVWFTDPPYYSAIGYSESADFFFVWLKQILPNHPLLRNPFEPDNSLTPKNRECIQDDTFIEIGGIRKDREFLEECVACAFAEGRRILCEDGVACVVFAHKTTEGWEALPSGMLDAGWIITASWPIETEMSSKVSGSQAGEKKAIHQPEVVDMDPWYKMSIHVKMPWKAALFMS